MYKLIWAFLLVAPLAASAADLTRIAQCRVNSSSFTLFSGQPSATPASGSVPVQALETLGNETYILSGEMIESANSNRFQVKFPVYLDVPGIDSGSCQGAFQALPIRDGAGGQAVVLTVHGYWLSADQAQFPSIDLCELLREGEAFLVDMRVLCIIGGAAVNGSPACSKLTLLNSVIPVDPTQIPSYCR